MHICILTPTFLPTIGGVEVLVDDMARTMQSLGHRVTVVAEKARRRHAPLELPYPVYRYRRPWSSRFDLYPITRMLRRVHRADPIDVVHAMVTYPTGYMAWRFHQRSGVPVVVTPHGDDIWPMSRYRGRPVIWERIRDTLRHAPKVTAIGRYMADLIGELTEGRKAPIVHNGVSPEALSPRPACPVRDDLRSLTKAPYILALGRLVRQKGYDMLIRAFDSMARKWPEHHLVIAGTGREQESLSRLIAKLRLQDRVHLVGQVTGDDKLYLLQNCQLLAMSSHYEGYSVVVLEALYCGRPVVGTRIAALSEVIQEGVNGTLGEPNIPESFADAMDRALQDPLHATLSQGAAATGAAHVWPLICQRYLEVYGLPKKQAAA